MGAGPTDGAGWDFLAWLGPDTSECVFRRLDRPADLARAAAVSRPWRRFVIQNGFTKSLCARVCPEVAAFARAVEVSDEAGSSSDAEMEHRVYSCLSGSLVSAEPTMDCVLYCVGASSTDNFPDESMENTLEPKDRVNYRPSYWSSGGQDDADVPESLTYRLCSELCVIDEIKIQPFKAYFQYGLPIYSSRTVRIRMGHSKDSPEAESYVTYDNENELIVDDDYVWTYTSPEFPMVQENVLQSFKLPRPALCIGGVLKIELLGRVQKQATDDKYYICVCHVQVIGRPLSPVLMADMYDPAGHSVLKYVPGARSLSLEDDAMPDYNGEDTLEWRDSVARYRQMRHLSIMNILLGPAQLAAEEDDDADGAPDEDPPV